MRIVLTKDATCNDLRIPSGEYTVTLATELSQICLVGGGKDYKLPAIRRRLKAHSKYMQVQFHSGGGALWSIIVITPKQGEWISTISYDKLK